MQLSQSEDCSSPPSFKRFKEKSKSVAILTTPDHDFIHMLIEDSYKLIDNSNSSTLKQVIDRFKRKETQLLKDNSKQLTAAKEMIVSLQKDRDVLDAQLEENRKLIREVKASVSCQVQNHKQKSKIELQKVQLELTNVKKEKSDFVAKRNSASVTHDLKHERNGHKRTKEHMNLVISNKDSVIKDLKVTIKASNDKVTSLESEIKSLNKELRAFEKSIAQEELKINGRRKLQGNKRKNEEKSMRNKLKKKRRSSKKC